MLPIRTSVCFLVCFSIPFVQETEPPLEITVRETNQKIDAQPSDSDLPATMRSVEPVDSVWYGTNRPRLNGNWRLDWNDEIGEDATEYPHTCNIEFKEINGVISGDFDGPVAGRERNAIISGQLQGSGQIKVLTFQQREQGYVCSYQAVEKGGEISGVWHDTQDRSGRFRLLKYQ